MLTVDMEEPGNAPAHPPAIPSRLAYTTKGKGKADHRGLKCSADADPNVIEDSEDDYDQHLDTFDDEDCNNRTPHRNPAHPSPSKDSKTLPHFEVENPSPPPKMSTHHSHSSRCAHLEPPEEQKQAISIGNVSQGTP